MSSCGGRFGTEAASQARPTHARPVTLRDPGHLPIKHALRGSVGDPWPPALSPPRKKFEWAF